MSDRLKAVQKRLTDRDLPFDYARQPEGDSILLSVDQSDCLLELWADGKLSCQFGVDMEELRTLVAGSSNEDIAEDELQRVARDHLRPQFQKYRAPFLARGFEEAVETTEHSYAVCFNKTVDLSDPEAAARSVQDCLSVVT
jgi:hypothetical protein